MKRVITVAGSLFLVLTLLNGISDAFLYDVNILPKTAIEKLSDEALIDAYIDVMIELEAAQTFHQTSGFGKASEYQKFKKLLRYRTDLIMEMRKRELEIPPINP